MKLIRWLVPMIITVCGTAAWAGTQTDAVSGREAKESADQAFEYVETGRYFEAIREYEKILPVYKDKAFIYYNLAIAYYGTGRVDEAIAYNRKAILVKPDHADAHANLGQALEKKGELEQALGSYRRSLELDPADNEVRLKLAVFYFNGGEPEKALAEYDRILAADADYGPALYWKGKALWKTGDYAGAWKHLHRARDFGYTSGEDPDAEFLKDLSEKMPEPEYVPPPKPANAVTQEFLDQYVKDHPITNSE